MAETARTPIELIRAVYDRLPERIGRRPGTASAAR